MRTRKSVNRQIRNYAALFVMSVASAFYLLFDVFVRALLATASDSFLVSLSFVVASVTSLLLGAAHIPVAIRSFRKFRFELLPVRQQIDDAPLPRNVRIENGHRSIPVELRYVGMTYESEHHWEAVCTVSADPGMLRVQADEVPPYTIISIRAEMPGASSPDRPGD